MKCFLCAVAFFFQIQKIMFQPEIQNTEILTEA